MINFLKWCLFFIQGFILDLKEKVSRDANKGNSSNAYQSKFPAIHKANNKTSDGHTKWLGLDQNFNWNNILCNYQYLIKFNKTIFYRNWVTRPAFSPIESLTFLMSSNIRVFSSPTSWVSKYVISWWWLCFKLNGEFFDISKFSDHSNFRECFVGIL